MVGPALLDYRIAKEAAWDVGLTAAMRAHDQAIDEEAIAAVLFQDLETSFQ